MVEHLLSAPKALHATPSTANRYIAEINILILKLDEGFKGHPNRNSEKLLTLMPLSESVSNSSSVLLFLDFMVKTFQ